MSEQPDGPGTTTTIDRPDVEERPETRPAEPGDHDRFSHYVDQRRYDLTEAMVMGTPVVAICGKVWVPSRDAKRYPVCPRCREIYEGLPSGRPPEGD